MKNLTRILSLALTTVMLLGMMVIGASAAFSDADEIVNTEAVEITAGLGLFAGSDGKFNPKDNVTRAQMATVIVKMLYGSDINADQFKGIGKFSDTASFEGGWAEGYINLCADQGVVSGYGDGTFKPGSSVTTAEAVTMIINALGIDAGKGTWPMTVMAKAEELELFEDMEGAKPGTNEAMTRDQLAVIVLAGLEYSPSGVSGYRVSGVDIVFESFSDALAIGKDATLITPVVGEDALINSVYEVKVSKGFITDNQAAGENVTVLTLNNGAEENFDVATGKELLGHYVTVYYKELYKSEKDPGKVYAVIDESEAVVVTETVSSAKEYKAFFGQSYVVADNGILFDGTYVPTEKLSDNMATAISGYAKGSAAPKGTYIIVDSEIVAYIAENISYASYIVSVNTTEGQESVLVNGANSNAAIPNTADDDRVVEYDGMSAGDFVSYVEIQGVFALTKLQSVSGVVTKSSKTEIDNITYDTLTVNDAAYAAVDANHSYIGKKLETNLSNIQYGQEYTLYINENNRFVGFESSDGAIDLNDAVYMLGVLAVSGQDRYGQNMISYSGRGVDMDGNEVMILVGQVADSDGDGICDSGEEQWGDTSGSLSEGFYAVEESTIKEDKKVGIQILTPYTQTCSAAGDTFVTTISKSASYPSSSGVLTSDGKYTFSVESSKYIVIDGTLDSSSPLETTVRTKSISSVTLAAGHPILVTRADNGATNTQEVVIIKGTPVDVLGEGVYVAYVTQEQLDSSGVTLDGFVYAVYDAKTTETKELVVDSKLAAPGFYRVAAETDGDTTVTAVQDKDTATSSLLYSNLGFGGMRTSTRMFASNTKKSLGSHTTKSLKVVDLRTDDEVERSGVPALSSLEQLNLLYDSDPGMVVIFDLYMTDASTDAANGMYITRAYRTSPGLDSIVYCHEPPAANGGEQMVTVVKSGSSDMGDRVLAAYDVSDTQEVGFYKFCVNASGQLSLIKVGFNDVEGTRGTMALHNTVVSLNNGLLTTTSKSGVSCDDTINEAMSIVNITDSTLIFDVAGQEVDVDSLTSGTIVNYYCSTAADSSDAAAADDTVELIFAVGAACSCAGVS